MFCLAWLESISEEDKYSLPQTLPFISIADTAETSSLQDVKQEIE